MECKYCGEQMIVEGHWFAKDPCDFEEIAYKCPYCESECDWSQPYGEEWYLGDIDKIQYKLKFNKDDLMEYKEKIDCKGNPIHFKHGIILGHYGILGWILNNGEHKIAQSKDWKRFKEMVENAM